MQGWVSLSCTPGPDEDHRRCSQNAHVCSTDRVAHPHCACACHNPSMDVPMTPDRSRWAPPQILAYYGIG